MQKRWFVPAAMVAALLLAIGFVFTSRATAQDMNATPSAMDSVPHPAHIHLGSCDSLGEVVFPLNDLAASSDMTPATPVEHEGMMMASPSATMDYPGVVVAESTTTVEASLDDIVAGGHAINVHESAENIGNYIACGNVSGSVMNGSLEVMLDELNGSGFHGTALLSDNGDGTTLVVVKLMMMDGEMATPTS